MEDKKNCPYRVIAREIAIAFKNKSNVKIDCVDEKCGKREACKGDRYHRP